MAGLRADPSPGFARIAAAFRQTTSSAFRSVPVRHYQGDAQMSLRRFSGDGVLARAGVIGFLTLLLLWPLGQVAGLVAERESVRDAARETIAARVGAQQWIAGPVLRVPVQRRRLPPATTPVGAAVNATPLWEDAQPVFLRSEDLEIEGTLQAEDLRKGLHRVPTYEATLVLRGSFTDAARLERSIDPVEERLLWDEARLVLPLSALESVRRIVGFSLDGTALETGGDGFMELRALAGRLPLDVARRERALPFEVQLVVSGSEALKLVPLSAATRIALRGNWPHPDFDGAEATAAREVTTAGFAARWSSTRLRWTVPPAWRGGTITDKELLAAGSGVTLFEPLDVYALNYRAVRYGVLFVAMTFLGLFAWEHAGRSVRLHPMQYLLVGLALAVFFLLLLALSEHVGFALAYALAAGALVLLVGYYVAGIAASRRVALAVSGALAAGYGLLYAILASEDQALLLGALTVFAALAALMLATRRLDWRGATGTATGARVDADAEPRVGPGIDAAAAGAPAASQSSGT
jgi:inner membrane protein